MVTVKRVKKMSNLAGEEAGNQVLLSAVARDGNAVLYELLGIKYLSSNI